MTDLPALTAPAGEELRSTPRLVVLIATDGRNLGILSRTLLSLAACEKPDNYEGCIVVENGGSDNASALAGNDWGNLRLEVRRIERAGKNAALNSAITGLSDRLVVFLDDDVRVAKCLLRAYASVAQGRVRGVYFGGPFGVDYEVAPPCWMTPFLPPSAVGSLDPPSPGPVCFPHYFIGFNWAAFSNDLRECGGFNEAFGPGKKIAVGDESFMQLSLNRIGARGQWVPEAMVWHHVPRERCTPRWAIERARVNGFAQGVWAQCRRSLLRQRFPLMRELLKQMRIRVCFADCRRAVLLRKEGRLWVRHSWAWFQGFLRGFRHGAVKSPLAARRGSLGGDGIGGARKAGSGRTPDPRPAAGVSSPGGTPHGLDCGADANFPVRVEP